MKFSWKKKDGSWSNPEPATNAKEAKEIAYEKRGRQRGGWVVGEDEEMVKKLQG